MTHKKYTLWSIHIHLNYIRNSGSRDLRTTRFFVFLLLLVFFVLLFSWLVLIGQEGGELECNSMQTSRLVVSSFLLLVLMGPCGLFVRYCVLGHVDLMSMESK
jgi:hypothetical protein